MSVATANVNLSVPTYKELRDRIAGDFEAHGLTGSRIRNAKAWVYARVAAGIAWGLHVFIRNMLNNTFADVAQGVFMLRIGSMWGITPRAGTYAAGAVLATGEPDTEIPDETPINREDGQEYLVVGDFTLDEDGEATIDVAAVAAGAAGNADASTPMVFASPISGLDSAAVVGPNGLTGGLDAESATNVEGVRARTLARMRNPPQGSADPDYKARAQEIANVGSVWVTPHGMGAGTVVVRFVMAKDSDGNDAFDGQLIPDSGKVAEVQAHLTDTTWRSITAHVYTVAPTGEPQTLQINISPDTADNRAAVYAELRSVLRRGRGPGLFITNEDIRGAIRNVVTAFTLVDVSGDGANAGIQQGAYGVAYLADGGITWMP